MKLKRSVRALIAIGFGVHCCMSYAEEETQRVEVTGSSIKRLNAETASPVVVISAKQIETMGANTLLQVLDNLPSATPALQDFRSMFTGSDGASQASLRNLGAKATLILLNGRRLSYYGAPAGFQTMFVNIDSIPAAAIERIDVLTDGASAIYGSDAIAGVINVITKKNFQGGQASASLDKSSNVSAYGEKQLSLSYGKGNLVEDGYNVLASFNYYKRDRIAFSDTYLKRPAQFYVNNPNFVSGLRIKEGSQPGELNPGTFFAFDSTGRGFQEVVPGCKTSIAVASGTSCVWNTLPNQLDTGPSSERKTIFLSGRKRFANGIEGFANLTMTDVELEGKNGPRAFSSGGGLTSWYSRNTGSTLNTFYYPYLGPNNVYLKTMSSTLKSKMGGAAGLSYLLQDATDHFGQRNTDRSYQMTAGIQTQIAGWDFDTALSIAGTKSVLYQTVNLNLDGFAKAFGPITIDPVTKRPYIADNPAYQFGVISEKNAALIREAFPTFDIPSKTQLITWDAKFEGNLFKMPAGEARAAFGINVMKEKFDSPGNPDAANGKITQQGGSWFYGNRTVSALFSEVLVPVARNLELTLAARADKYPNFATNISPKLGIKYRPFDFLMVRSSYSEGFRAPNLAESGTGGVYAQAGGFNDKLRCNETNAIANLLIKSVTQAERDLGRSLLNSNCSTNIAGYTPPNPNLQPEKANIVTFGTVFQIAKDYDLSLDYWYVDRKNEIVRQSFTEVYDQAVAKYGLSLIGAPNLVRLPITDADKANQAAVITMCANPANATACASGVPKYSVGILGGITNTYLNRNGTKVDGFDINANARFNLNGWGKLRFGALATVLNRTTYNSGGAQSTQNYVGFYGNPRVRANFTASWLYEKLTTTLYMNYTGSTRWATSNSDMANSNATTCKAGGLALAPDTCGDVPSYKTFNLALNYKHNDNWNVSFNIKNLANTQPFYNPYGWEGYSHQANLFGRIFNVRASYQFK